MALDETCNHEFLRLEAKLTSPRGMYAVEVYVCSAPKSLNGKYRSCGVELHALPRSRRKEWFFEKAEDAVYVRTKIK